MIEIFTILATATIGVLGTWIGLSYSNKARRKYSILAIPDGRKHLFFLLITLLFVSVAGLQIFAVISKPSFSQRDCIAATQLYYDGVGIFWARFRLNLIAHESKADPKINEVFYINDIKRGIDVDKLDREIIEYLFTNYEFSKPAINFTPGKGSKHPTNMEWLLGDLTVLKSACEEVLLKYASSCNPELINRIELLLNRTENLLGPFGLLSPHATKEEIAHSIADFFIQLKLSQKLISKIWEEVEPPKEESSNKSVLTTATSAA